MSRRAPSWLSTTQGEVYTLHFWPPYGDPEVQLAKHYTGWAEAGRLTRRLSEHTLGRGARLTQVQREAGGTWILADVQPGTRDREQQLKERGAARRCGVCKAIAEYQAGQLSQPEALARAGWARATPHERGLLLEMFDLEQAPEGIPEQAPETRPVRSAPEIRPITPLPGPQPVTPEQLAELEILVDALEERWRQEVQAELGADAGRHAAADVDLAAPGPEAEPAADWLQGPDGSASAAWRA